MAMCFEQCPRLSLRLTLPTGAVIREVSLSHNAKGGNSRRLKSKQSRKLKNNTRQMGPNDLATVRSPEPSCGRRYSGDGTRLFSNFPPLYPVKPALALRIQGRRVHSVLRLSRPIKVNVHETLASCCHLYGWHYSIGSESGTRLRVYPPYNTLKVKWVPRLVQASGNQE
ncbi:hypothetical protein PoB_004030200 [Plakobranchus ocellatus]|uniref:Uncharacterized protein n=1 Tax=Plakobranchus ocellatus TaxID=259542 RepID=A0AAV4B3K4_9GAST|nr:hypothetical protein PoB_004030200 [Plakobranchus ocellatus]